MTHFFVCAGGKEPELSDSEVRGFVGGLEQVDDLVEEDLILDQPSKVLCSEECRGLCPMCGKDLNEGSCDCRRETVDPRLAALQQLLD